MRILGQGKRAWDAPTGRTGLRQATLTTIADRACGPKWKGTKYAKRFEAASEVCAGGRASVCAGDSGGPMIGGTLDKPVLVGIISWTGPRCGEDKLPSVSAEAAHYADFLTAPEPVWAPTPAGPTTITRSGDTLTCTATWTIAPDTVEFRWRRRVRGKTALRVRHRRPDGDLHADAARPLRLRSARRPTRAAARPRRLARFAHRDRLQVVHEPGRRLHATRPSPRPRAAARRSTSPAVCAYAYTWMSATL